MNKMIPILLVFFIVRIKVLADINACCPNNECDDIVCQPCKDPTQCPGCFDNCMDNTDLITPCCRLLSQVSALTAASVDAAVKTFAATQACVSAATSVTVSAATAASTGAFVSICQSISLTVNPGSCCQVSADVQANATSYSIAVASAAAEAEAAAAVVASAASAAVAASSAAATLFSQAVSLVKSSCCGFNAEVYSSAIAAGRYVLNAAASSKAAVSISATAQQLSAVCVKASTTLNIGTSAWATAKIDNCCVSSKLRNTANSSASASISICTSASDLQSLISTALQSLSNYTQDDQRIATPGYLESQVCTSECSDISLSCCSMSATQSCCSNNNNTVCLASKNAAKVYIGARAVTETLAEAVAYGKAQTLVYTNAIATAFVAAKAASDAAVSINVNVTSCCSINVYVDTTALGNAKAVADAVAKAQAAAYAFSSGYASANATAIAISEAIAYASVVSETFYDSCCGSRCCDQITYSAIGGGPLKCCDVTSNITNSYSYKYHELVQLATSSVSKMTKSVSVASASIRSSDCSNMMKRVLTKSAFLLQCCCCTTKNLRTTQKSSYKQLRVLTF